MLEPATPLLLATGTHNAGRGGGTVVLSFQRSCRPIPTSFHRPTIDPLAARLEAPVPLRLSDGPGARALAVVVASRIDLLGERWEVVASGDCAGFGLAAAPTSGVPTRMEPGATVDPLTAFASCDLIGAHIAWERAGRPAATSWLESVFQVCAGDLAEAERLAWACAAEVSLSWRMVSVLLVSLARGRLFEAGPMLDALEAHPPDPAVAFGRVLRGFVRGEPTNDPRYVGWNRILSSRGDPIERIAHLGLLASTASDPRSPLARTHTAASRGLLVAYDDPEAPIPAASHLGAFARAGLLIAGARALQKQDRRALRRTAAQLERLTLTGVPRSAVDLATRATGDSWDTLLWCRALEGQVAPGDRPGVRTRIAELEASMEVVGDYLLHERIGSGAMGSVFRATHMPTNQMVAIKRMHDATSAAAAQRFEAEIALVARLEHPAVASVLDHGRVVTETDAVTPYLVMEHVEGGPLTQASLSWSWNLVRAVALALTDAVAYAHSRNILHRDIKPENVLVAADGTVRLVDFGLGVLPRKGVVAGTPPYMAPEQLRGFIDARTDVYGLGALVWTLCTGAPPYLGSLEALRRVDRSRPPPFEARFEVPAQALEALHRALHPDPAQRFPTAASLAEALAALPELDHVPVVGFEPHEPMYTLNMETLVDFVPEAPTVEAAYEEQTAGLFEGMDRLHFRPRVPTLSMVRAGDPPLLFRKDSQHALWVAFLKSLSARRPLHVRIEGPPSSGRRALVAWLLDTTRRHGFPIATEPGEPGHPVRVDQDLSTSGAGLCMWVEAAPPHVDRTIRLEAFRPFQVFTILCSRLRLSFELAHEAAKRSVGSVDLALDILEDWFEGVGLVPTVHGLRLLGETPETGPRQQAWWARRVADTPEPVLASLRVLAARPAGFDDRDVKGLEERGLPAIDPLRWAVRWEGRLTLPTALLELLGPVEQEPHSWRMIRSLPYYRKVPQRAARDWLIQALNDREATAADAARLELMLDADPTWRRQDAMEEGSFELAAFALHAECVYFSAPAPAVVQQVFDRCRPATPAWRAAGVALALTLEEHGEAEALLALHASCSEDTELQAAVAMFAGMTMPKDQGAAFAAANLHPSLPPAVYLSLAVLRLQLLHLAGEVEEAAPLVTWLRQRDSLRTGQVMIAAHAVLSGDLEAARIGIEDALMEENWSVWREVALLLLLGVRLDAPSRYWAQWASMAKPYPDDWVRLVVTAAIAHWPSADPERVARLRALIA